MNKKFFIKKQKRVSKPICKRKIPYKNKLEAWESAEWHYIKYSRLYDVYKCPCGDHYHLTSNTSLGDASHFPSHLIDLFKTVEIEPKETFWHKLRKVLG